MIDLHSHVLPGVDDGPADVEGSLAMARRAVALGTSEIVATPHVSWDIPTAAATMLEAVEALQRTLDEQDIPLRVRTGGEVAITRAIELAEDELLRLRLGGGEWLLAECPLSVAAIGFDTVLFQLQARGHRIVLAHPERSPMIQRDPDVLRRLVDAGMLSSITAGSLVGKFGSAVQRFTHELVTAGLVHNVASDAHSADRRGPGLAHHLDQADAELPGLADQATWLCVDVPRAILDGGPVPPPPGPPPQRRKRRGVLRRSR